MLAQGSIGDRGLPGPASAITLHARELDQSVLGGIRLRGATDRAAWSARAWGRLDRVELRGVQAFGDCVDGTAECPRNDQRASAVRGEAEGKLAAGDSQWLSITLSAGQERVHGRGLSAQMQAGPVVGQQPGCQPPVPRSLGMPDRLHRVPVPREPPGGQLVQRGHLVRLGAA